MKSTLIFSLVFILTLPFFIAGCEPEKESSDTINTKTIEITLDEFSAKKKQVEFFEMAYPGTVTVRLGSNPTTGYSWAVTDISSPEVVELVSNNYEEPAITDLVGAGGTEVWVFNVNDTGLSIISMSYSQPWESGEKDLYTVTITVNVKVLLITY
jgi:inhibitor of cysteine peptidase